MKNVVDTTQSIGQIINTLKLIDDMTNSIYPEMQKQQATNKSVNFSMDDLKVSFYKV